MDFSGAPRAFPVATQQAVPRADVLTQPGSAPVDLPAEKTVRSAPAGEALQLDIRARSQEARKRDAQRAAASRADDKGSPVEQMRDVIERRLMIDPKTRSIVVQETNRDTGEKVSQLPDETILKLRALSRDLIERARGSLSEPRPHLIERTA